MGDRVAEIVLAKLREPVPGADVLVNDVRNHSRFPDEPYAILLYGSTLSATTRRPSSIHDVYVVVQHLRRFHKNSFHAFLNTFLPPNVYFRVCGSVRYKLCVISLEQLVRETGAQAHDLHHLGRMSKRMTLAWARDDSAAESIARACAAALRTLVPHVLARLPAGFGLEQFGRALLGLSYIGETRVAEVDKVEAVFRGEETYYLSIVQALLEECGGAADGRATDRLLARSRRRERLRWPKYIFTFDNWLDYLLDKLERHQGIRLELTERERRFPLLFAWGKYFALKRKGMVK